MSLGRSHGSGYNCDMSTLTPEKDLLEHSSKRWREVAMLPEDFQREEVFHLLS
jgi:hypothetical protein